MKKIILGLTSIALCLVLSACGTNTSDATITSLSNQLDETSNTINNIQTVNPSDISLTKSMLETTSTQNNEIYSTMENTQQTLLNEQYYKTDILTKTAKIKNYLSKDIKLSKTQASAVKDLTKLLGKYSNSVAYSENELTNSVKSVSSMKKNYAKNSDKINAKLNRIACNSNARSAYFENLINTLDEIDRCLCPNCEETQQNDMSDEKEQQIEDSSTDRAWLQKNIDSYITKSTNDDENIDQDSENQTTPTENNNVYNRFNRYQLARNIDTYAPFNPAYGYYGGGYGNMPYGAPYGYGRMGMGYGGAGMGGYGSVPYGYNSNNINRMQNVAFANTENNPPRLENFEEKQNDGTLKEVESIDEKEKIVSNEYEAETQKETKDCQNCEPSGAQTTLSSTKLKPANDIKRHPNRPKTPKNLDKDDGIVIAY